MAHEGTTNGPSIEAANEHVLQLSRALETIDLSKSPSPVGLLHIQGLLDHIVLTLRLGEAKTSGTG